ncbi:hypothetical protein ACK3TF_005958 [Chlorella vulgaris]
MVKPVDEAAAARGEEVTLAASHSHANTRRALAAVAIGSLAMAGSVLVFNPARRWVAERVEDAACSKLPKEMQNRLIKMRAWRNSLSTRQARSFAATGLLGRDLHGLIPSVEGEGYYYGQDLEKQFAAAVPGGATVYKHELAWVERSVGSRGEMDWTPVPARLNALRNENSLLVPAHMAEELGFEEGNLVTISIAGRHFTLPIAILAASPEEVEVVQEVFDAAQASSVKLTAARLVADVAQLRADYARMVTVPRAVLTALLADNITLILHS